MLVFMVDGKIRIAATIHNFITSMDIFLHWPELRVGDDVGDFSSQEMTKLSRHEMWTKIYHLLHGWSDGPSANSARTIGHPSKKKADPPSRPRKRLPTEMGTALDSQDALELV